jgi:hypothetical protein
LQLERAITAKNARLAAAIREEIRNFIDFCIICKFII